ncbi:hypothetical protein E1263_05640 [Kribbella antibiotica]|uniref:Uncharacterized protein n=1 Tax=Kribbella antibiotica TaxID=190195 RepID=A0A4R4ZV33_9ACTN|nr:hypothetical protein [Kribbella antibiotica]TDD61869.1 hypothetical protein E1263_05640 [Kribbella antibiotica]
MNFEQVTCASYPDFLRQTFPQRRDKVDEGVRPGVAGDWLVAHDLTRNVLTGHALDDAVGSGDDEQLGRWFAAVEVLLASADNDLRDAVLHGAPNAVWQTAARARASQLMAGPLLASAIDDHYGDATWRTKTDWLDEPVEELPHGASLAIYSFRGQLLAHGRRYDAVESTYPTSRPFARLPVEVRPVTIGEAVAGLLSELAADTSEVQQQLDEFLKFAQVDWRTLYTGSLIVTVEIRSLGGDVRVWAHEGEQRGDLFVSQPMDQPAAANWHQPEELGAAVLAALRRSSTTGWTELE